MSATQTGTMPRKRQIAVLAFLLAFSALCYAAIIPTYFVSDDFVLIGKVAEQGMYSRHGENGETASFCGLARPCLISSITMSGA